jgi:hypothetical protein
LTLLNLYAIIYINMQNGEIDSNQALSRLRQELRRLIEDLARSMEVVFERTPLVKGSVYAIARKCGKPNCACTRGELHKSMVLSWSQQGKTRLKSVSTERLAEISHKSEEYLRFRRARAQVTIINKQMLDVIDRIESLRREEP